MASWFGVRAKTPPVDPAAAQAANGRPLLLIGLNEQTKQWELGADALSVLKNIRGPLCTISVCGRARQGKSFLLNQMLTTLTGVSMQKPKGFTVSPTHQSCTRGIWIWSAPIPVTASDGTKLNTVLMDCEGVDAVDQGQQHSAQIFCLAVLLSSVFIFNQLGAIDSIAVERLAMVCELAKRIRGKRGQVDFHPAFIWLLRDFQLLLKEGRKTLTPSEYLEETLNSISGTQTDVANRNQMRGTIKAVFPDRDAWTLVRPAMEEVKLQQLDTLPAQELRPEFRQGMETFIKLLREKARPLEINGVQLGGRAYTGLADKYVRAINEGGVPELVTAWQGVSRAECKKALEGARGVYSERFKEDPSLMENQLYDMHKEALDAALKHFKEHAMGDAPVLSEYEGRLRAEAEGRYETAAKNLAIVGEKAAVDMLAKGEMQLQRLMATPGVTLEMVEAELKGILHEYERKVQNGPYKYKKASEFMMNSCIIGIKKHVAGIITAKEAAERKVATLEQQLGQVRLQAQESSGRLAALQRELSEAQDASDCQQAQAMEAAREIARLQGELAAKARQLEQAEAAVTQVTEQLSAAGGQERQLKEQLQEARNQVLGLEARLGQAQEMQQEVARLQQVISTGTTQLQQVQQQELAAKQEASRLASELASMRLTLSQQEAQLVELSSTKAENLGLRSQLMEKEQELGTYRVGGSRVEGERDAERKKATENLTRLHQVERELIDERTSHDATREQLRLAQQQVDTLASPARSQPGGSGGRTPAAAAGAPGTGTATARKRQATATPGDSAGAGGVAVQNGGVGDAGAEAGARRTGGPTRVAKRQRVQQQEPEAMDEDPDAFHDAEDGPAAAGAAAGPVNKAIEPSKMTVNELKAWITDHRLEDEEFMTVVRGKKADLVKYVQKRLNNLP